MSEQTDEIDDGGPAFPKTGTFHANGPAEYDSEDQDGMSLRDWFAGKAMQAEMITTFSDATPGAADAFSEAAAAAGRTPNEHLAANAYAIADAMLRARKGAQPK
jgi:hypothetical protein